MEENEKKAPELDEKNTSKAKKKSAKESGKPSLFARIASFFRSYRSEVKKIVWCPWKQVRKNSLVVIVVVVVCATVVCLLDLAFSRGILTLGTLI